MRILLVSHYLPPNGTGGVENYSLLLARALAEQGHDIMLYARGTRDDLAPEQPEAVSRFTTSGQLPASVRVIEVHNGGNSLVSEKRDRWEADRTFASMVNEFKPDVVHFHHLMYHSLGYPRIARAAGAATLMTLHDFWMTCPVVQRRDFAGNLCNLNPGIVCAACVWGGRKSKLLPPALLRRLSEYPITRPALNLLPVSDELADWTANSARALSHIDTLISPSRFLRDDVLRRGIEHPHFVLSDYGIPRPDAAALQSAIGSRPSDNLLHFGVIGTHHLKGMHVAVEAFRRLPNDVPARLHLWGVANWDDAPANVIVEGRFGIGDIERVYGGMDVLIVPSIWFENAPFVIREAFARLRPVVASNIGGMAESVTDGVDGLHFEVGDADALAASVCCLTEEPGLLIRLREGIRPPKFYDEHIGELVHLYNEASDPAHPGAPRPKVGL